MEQTERQRQLLSIMGVVTPCTVAKVHYTILSFGNEKKPYHFAVNQTVFSDSLDIVEFIPLSTNPKNKRYTVELNLAKHSDCKEAENERLDRVSYAILRNLRGVKLAHLFNQPATHFRGKLTPEKCREIKAARRNYILWHRGNKKSQVGK
ncbi:MAG: hypothetical protein LC102_06470 [Ignavibacteriales bacterium]|nr:MAG: hypothetical protein F9K26_08510 [Ignavibacteriaceae bacterium]MBW7873315.1 hypothetical protein [Ignavibacteria bacterium]MCZ2143052.1 hypothetical protein [Ignavibacteriales bacterium]MBV6444742.1 hypothetical protein [Ignavibacteriaceae bacterium]MBZ0195989.1 hypothetical protein [Ignavibacteriaceae bacterium]